MQRLFLFLCLCDCVEISVQQTSFLSLLSLTAHFPFCSGFVLVPDIGGFPRMRYQGPAPKWLFLPGYTIQEQGLRATTEVVPYLVHHDFHNFFYYICHICSSFLSFVLITIMLSLPFTILVTVVSKLRLMT